MATACSPAPQPSSVSTPKVAKRRPQAATPLTSARTSASPTSPTTSSSPRNNPTRDPQSLCIISLSGTSLVLETQRASAMTRSNQKHKIIEHYDVVSPFYRSLWGEHLHHGYWIRGDESKEQAQLQLTEHLAQLANVKTGSDILAS